MESFGAIGQEWEIEAIPASTQRTGWLGRVESIEKCFNKTDFRYN